MAISLNEGSYGLLMDPTNVLRYRSARPASGIELRLPRQPSPARRATRLKARLGFELEERTQTRYENAKGMIGR